MRVTRVVYAMLRSTRQYENDRAECVVDLSAGATQEDIDAAYAEAKRQCAVALGRPASDVRAAVREAKQALDRVVDPYYARSPKPF